MEKYMSKNYVSYGDAEEKEWYLVPVSDEMRDKDEERLVRISLGYGKTYICRCKFWSDISEGDIVVTRNKDANMDHYEKMGCYMGTLTDDEAEETDADDISTGEIWQIYKNGISETTQMELRCGAKSIVGSGIKNVLSRMASIMETDAEFYDWKGKLTIVEDDILDVILCADIIAFSDQFEPEMVKMAKESLSKPRRLCTEIFDTKFTNMLRLIQSINRGSSKAYEKKRGVIYDAMCTWDGHDDNYADKFKLLNDDCYYDDAESHSICFEGCYPEWEDQFQSLSICDELYKYSEYAVCSSKEIIIFEGSEKIAAMFREDKEFCDFYNELIYRSAISLLVRGGFVNLLKALLSAKPPIEKFIGELCEFSFDVGPIYCTGVLDEYGKEKNVAISKYDMMVAEDFVHTELEKISPEDKQELFREILTNRCITAVENVDKIDFVGKVFNAAGLSFEDTSMVRGCLKRFGGTYSGKLRCSVDYLIVDTDSDIQNNLAYRDAWMWKLSGRTRWLRIISFKQFCKLCGVKPSGSANIKKSRPEITVSDFIENYLPEMLVEAGKKRAAESDRACRSLKDLVSEIPFTDEAVIVDSVENFNSLIPAPKEYTQEEIDTITLKIKKMLLVDLINKTYVDNITRNFAQLCGFNYEESEEEESDDGDFDEPEEIDIKQKLFFISSAVYDPDHAIGDYIEMNGGVSDYNRDSDYMYADYVITSLIPGGRDYNWAIAVRNHSMERKPKVISLTHFCILCGIDLPDKINVRSLDEDEDEDEEESTPESAPISEEPTCDEPSAEEETEPAPEPAAEPAPETEAPCDPESSMIPADAEGEPLSASGMSFTEALGTEWFVVTPAGKKFRKQCIVFPDGRRCEFNTQYDHTPEDVVVIGGDGKYFGMIGRPDFSGAPVTEYDTDGRVRFVFRKDPTEEDVRKMSRRLTSLSDSDASMKRYISERVGDEDVVADIVNDTIETVFIECAIIRNRRQTEKELRFKAYTEVTEDKHFNVRMFEQYLNEVNGKEGKRTGQKSGVVIEFNGYFSGWKKERDSLGSWEELSKKRGCEAVPGKLRFTDITKPIVKICLGDWRDSTFDAYYGSLIFKSAFSIIVRCGLANLLQGALGSFDNYDKYLEGFKHQFNSIIEYLRDLARSVGSKYCVEMIEAYMRGEEPCLANKAISAKRAALTLGVDWKELFEKKKNEKRLGGVEFNKEKSADFYAFDASDSFCIAGFDEETTRKIEEFVISTGYKIEAPEDVHLMSMDHLVINEFAEKIPAEYEMWLEKRNREGEWFTSVNSFEKLCDGFNWGSDLYWEI